MPVIRKFLDLSTGNLDECDKVALASYADEGSVKGPLTLYSPYGWFMYASEEADIDPDLTPNLARIAKYAQEHGCDYVFFDCDAEVDEALPSFEEVTA